MMLFLKNLLFTLVVPGTVAVYGPLFIAQNHPPPSGPLFALALAMLALGGAIYAWCVWDFATFGRGTPASLRPRSWSSEGCTATHEIRCMWGSSR